MAYGFRLGPAFDQEAHERLMQEWSDLIDSLIAKAARTQATQNPPLHVTVVQLKRRKRRE